MLDHMRNFCLCCPTSVLDPAKLKKEKKKKEIDLKS